MKKSFLLYCDIINVVKKLPKEKVGELFILILEFVNGNEIEPDDVLLQVAFEPIKNSLIRDKIKYEQIVETRREAGKKGGEARVKNLIEEEEKLKQMQAIASSCLANEANGKQNLANQADSDSVSDSVSDSDSDSEKERDIPVSDETVFTTSTNLEQPHELKTDEATTKQKKETPPPSSGAPPPLKFDYDKFLEFFNSHCIVKVQVFSDVRKKLLNKIIAKYSKEQIITVIKKLKTSSFLNGTAERKGHDTWKPDFDWVFNEKYFVKILEGKYDDTKPQQQPKQQQPQRDYLDPSYGKYV